MTEQEYDNLRVGDIVYYIDYYYKKEYFGVVVKKDKNKIWCRNWCHSLKMAIKSNKNLNFTQTWMSKERVFLFQKRYSVEDDPEYSGLFI